MRRWLALVAVGLLGCRGQSATGTAPATATGTATATAPATAPAPASAPAPAPALTGFFEALPVPDHPDAWLSLPTGATGKRPVVVVIHGAGDRPDWQCGGWRRATEGYAFIVCPRGDYNAQWSTRDDLRYTHKGGAALLAHIDAALAALAVRYPDHADTGTPLLAGFSLGASEVLALAVQSPSRFPRLALVEGATDGWTDARIAAYGKGGGQRVLYGCGQRGNELGAKAQARRLDARGLDARVVFAPVNHTFDPPLEDAIHGELAWLVDGDARWHLGP